MECAFPDPSSSNLSNLPIQILDTLSLKNSSSPGFPFMIIVLSPSDVIESTSNIFTNNLTVGEVCSLYVDVFTGNVPFYGADGFIKYLEGLYEGARIYRTNPTNPCICNLGDGNYMFGQIANFPETITIVTVENCYITQLTQCNVNDYLY